ncbi:phage tail protein [Serratia sp. 22264]|uniref:phage tail protein n=1 Tax=Serratia sp. 22264 TaxID=3453897 RepID=UPI003F85A00C
MGSKKFIVLTTHLGNSKLAAAAVSGVPLNIEMMAVGDGNGQLPQPAPEQTGLINERYRAELNRLSISDQSAEVIEAEMIMPPQIGGFWLREVALYDADGGCIAVGNMPDTYKPLLSEGSGRYQVIRMQLQVSNAALVEMLADPSVVLATSEAVKAAEDAAKDYSDEQLGQHERSRNHPDATLKEKGFTQLSSATDSDSEALAATPAAIKKAIAAAVRESWELSNPVGISHFFFANVDPNARWPWSKWEYTGEGRTVRIAKRDGSNVGQTGGSDTTTISRANLPAEKISVNGTAHDTDLGTKRTKAAGAHVHHGTPQRNSNYELGGNNRVFFDPYAEGDTDEAGEHDHEMDLGPHGHNVTGETDALGSGQAVSIVESHVLQMCWHRIA